MQPTFKKYVRKIYNLGTYLNTRQIVSGMYLNWWRGLLGSEPQAMALDPVNELK